MPKLKKQNIMGKYIPTNKELDAAEWCIKNNIHISPLKKNYKDQLWYIDIIINGKSSKSPETFGPSIIWQKLYEYASYYYNKYRNENNI
jgi:hypothetical protein